MHDDLPLSLLIRIVPDRKAYAVLIDAARSDFDTRERALAFARLMAAGAAIPVRIVEYEEEPA